MPTKNDATYNTCMLFLSDSSFEESRLTKSVKTIVAEELMLVATVDIPAENKEAMISPVSPVGTRNESHALPHAQCQYKQPAIDNLSSTHVSCLMF